MKAIWKFDLQLQDAQTIRVPRGAKPMCVQLQHGEPVIWALVDPTAERENWQIRTVGTGHPFNEDGWHYLGTWQRDGYVWHVFTPEPRL